MARALREVGDPRGVDALRDYQQAVVGKYQRETEKLQSTGIASSTLFLDEVPLNNEEQASVDDITQEEASRLQSQLRHLPARHPKQVQVVYRIPLQVRGGTFTCSQQKHTSSSIFHPPQEVGVKLVLDCPDFLLHSASIATPPGLTLDRGGQTRRARATGLLKRFINAGPIRYEVGSRSVAS